MGEAFTPSRLAPRAETEPEYLSSMSACLEVWADEKPGSMTQETSMERASFVLVIPIVYGAGAFFVRAVQALKAQKKGPGKSGPFGLYLCALEFYRACAYNIDIYTVLILI